MANNRIAGVAYLRVDGRQIEIGGKWTTNLGIGGKREPVVGQDGVHGYKEMPIAPMFKGDGVYGRNTSIEAVRGIEDATITLELANGAVHVLRNGWCSDEIESNTEDGTYGLTFHGLSGEEIRAPRR